MADNLGKLGDLIKSNTFNSALKTQESLSLGFNFSNLLTTPSSLDGIFAADIKKMADSLKSLSLGFNFSNLLTKSSYLDGIFLENAQIWQESLKSLTIFSAAKRLEDFPLQISNIEELWQPWEDIQKYADLIVKQKSSANNIEFEEHAEKLSESIINFLDKIETLLARYPQLLVFVGILLTVILFGLQRIDSSNSNVENTAFFEKKFEGLYKRLDTLTETISSSAENKRIVISDCWLYSGNAKKRYHKIPAGCILEVVDEPNEWVKVRVIDNKGQYQNKWILKKYTRKFKK